MVTGKVKLLGSLDFCGKDFLIIALYLAFNSTVSYSGNFLFFVSNSFMDLA